jgi:hypothetical protein
MQFHSIVAGLLALGAAGLAGCQSSQPSSGYSQGLLTIKGHTDAQIRQVTKAVFAEDGYAFVSEGGEGFVFQRPGTRGDALKYGGWYSEGVVLRAKVRMTEMGVDSYVLKLDMFVVRNAGDGLNESESPLMTLNKAPYNRLMEEIGKRLPPP